MAGVGERIRSIRGSRTQRAFADSLGISTQALINYERHGRTPKQQILNKISNVYGINVEWLLTGMGAMTAQGASQGKEESLDTKIADTSAVFCNPSEQPIENIDSAKYKNANVSAVLPQELTSRCLRLADENAALLRENGDLRVEVERLKNQLNQAKEARPNDDALLAKLVQENKDLRARLKRFERAGLVVPPLTDIAQNRLPERK